MLQLHAYLIHHHDPARHPQRQEIGNLLQQLGIPLTCISDQPPLQPLPSGSQGRWWVIRGNQEKLAADFAQRRLRCPKLNLNLLIKEGWVRLKQALLLIISSYKLLNSEWRQLQVEAIVRAKHEQAWIKGMQEDIDAIFVFEDDAAVLPESLPRLRKLIMDLPELLQNHELFFCDLAGGYPLDLVAPLDTATLSASSVEYIIEGIHTNTACAYLASRELLRAWLQPGSCCKAKYLPIDHHINRSSVSLITKAVCGHWHVPPLKHGSFCGLADSWQSSNQTDN